MPPAKFSQYYKDGMNKMLDYLNEKQCLAIRIDEIQDDVVVFTVGVSDGNEFILEFGTLSMKNGSLVHVQSDNIYVDMYKMIRMEYHDKDPEEHYILKELIGG